MSIEFDIIKEVVKRLDEVGIHYMITGSIAANFYSIPRMTRDIDIVIELKKSNVERVYNAFEKDFYIDKDMVFDAVKRVGMFNVIHYEAVFKVDFIVRKNDQYNIEGFKRRKKVKVDDLEFYIASPEDLILSKLCWAKDGESDLQITDVKNLLKQTKELDEDYLARWAKYLGVEELYKKVKL
jgi:uncharacterized protein (DUF1499 family)